MFIAITRQVSPGIIRCELTHLEREEIDFQVATAQHTGYEAGLVDLGCRLHRLPAEPDLPDSVFVEDVAIVLDEVAVLTRPGVESRRPETASIADALRPYRELVAIEAPGTLDGGDVLRVGRQLYVGRSARSNDTGIAQLRAFLTPFGYQVTAVDLTGCLHLKSAVSLVAENTLLVNREWVDPTVFGPVQLVDVDPAEPFAANALLIGETVIHPAAFPRTRARLEARDILVKSVEIAELAKAEGGVTCCSLIFRDDSKGNDYERDGEKPSISKI